MFISCFSKITFSDVCQPTFSKFSDIVWIWTQYALCYDDFNKKASIR